MLDFNLWTFAIVCGAIGIPMLILALIQEFEGHRTCAPRAKYPRS